ncbi:16195_t:CDS:2 [Acaulospora colombiana]|uniref:16195_t:CDS:1 n=1 Tax=Acaulospora colombiana TaxID=27376 RepID=A0ACA9K3X1_9GLOM|nr:16195_t:CDS:2 [Acaulospora colombiana]
MRVTAVKSTHGMKRFGPLSEMCRRELSTETSQDVIGFPWKAAVLMFVGIPFSVYLYKNKLIYMPFFPLGSRKMSFDEVLIDNRLVCQKVVVDTEDKHKLFGIMVKRKSSSERGELDPILIYFQG